MRIGLDYTPAARHAPGVGRYARELVAALARLPSPPRLALLEFGGGPPRLPAAALRLPPDAPLRRRRLPLPARAGRLLARLGLGAETLAGGCDLFHQLRPGALLALGPRQPWTVSISELPDTPQLEGWARPLTPAAGVLVFSAHTRRRLSEQAGLDPSRIHVVPVGSDHWSRVRSAPAAPPERSRLVALGAPLPGRRHAELLDAAAALVRGGLDLDLLLVGRGLDVLRGTPAAEVLGPRLLLHAPDESALPGQLAEATTLVHLAGEEQTAVTLLEACAAGLTVVASRQPAFVEALGASAHWVDDAPLDDGPALLAERLAAALAEAADTDARQRRLALAARHRWADCAAATQAVWARLLPG